MARRAVTEEEFRVLDPAALAEESDKGERRRTRTPKKAEPARKRRIPWIYWLLPMGALFIAFFLALGFHQVEAFLIRDVRFAILGPSDYGGNPEGLHIDGRVRASKAELLRVFERDLNRSLYLFPVEERRRNLLAVDWVKTAAVSRHWPNQVAVKITEREPVAFAQIERRDGSTRHYLIDAEGVLLPIPKGETFDKFIVLQGLGEQEPEESRKVRVHQAMLLQKEAGPLAAFISEVNVADPGDLRATMKLDNAVVTLRLGSEEIGRKLRRFVKRFPEILEKRPEARFFDLRMGDRVIAVEGAPHGK